MNWTYSYTPYLWPNLASTVFVLALGVYNWRRRKVPGARAFAFLMLFWSLIAIGASLVLAVQESAGKIYWFKFQFYWQGLAAIAGLFFVLEFARLDRFLTRRFLIPVFIFIDIGILGSEIGIGTGQDARYYSYNFSSLTDRRGGSIGRLLLLHDVTDIEKAQEQLLEQGQVVAILQERERLARELHDSLGQVLGYVSMHAQAIQKWVRDGNLTVAETQLARLARTAQQAHNDLRESILNLKSDPAEGWSFFHALQHHLESYRNYFAVDTELVIPTTMSEDIFEPSTKVHLLRVIQEAFTNARKHGHARCVQVTFERQDSQVRVVVTDDGRGFDPGQVLDVTSSHYGLAFMRERMAQIDGRLVIESRPGMGTRVVLDVPICIEWEEEK